MDRTAYAACLSAKRFWCAGALSLTLLAFGAPAAWASETAAPDAPAPAGVAAAEAALPASSQGNAAADKPAGGSEALPAGEANGEGKAPDQAEGPANPAAPAGGANSAQPENPAGAPGSADNAQGDAAPAPAQPGTAADAGNATGSAAGNAADDSAPAPAAPAPDAEAPATADAQDDSPYERIADGAYTITIGSDKMLDIVGGSTADNGKTQIYEDNGSSSQRFHITNVGRDANHEWLYYITNIGSGRVLEAHGGATSSGTSVSQYGFNGSEAQLWYIRKVEGEDGTTRYCFVNYKSGLLMTVKGSSVEDAAGVVLRKQSKTALQNWLLNPCDATIADGAYTVGMAKDASAVLDIEAASTDDGAQVQVYESNGSVAQAYAFNYDPWSGYYYITSYASGKVLTVTGGDADGSLVQQYDFTGSPEQLWSLIKNADGSFTLKSAFGGRVLDVLAGSTANGTKVQIYAANGTIAQSFILSATTPVYNGGRFNVANRGNDRIVLDVASASRDDGARLQGYASNDSMAQKFNIVEKKDGTFVLAAMVSGLYVGVAADGTVCQQNVSEADAMRWRFVPTNDGHFAIVSADGRYVLALRLYTNDASVRAYASAGQLSGAAWTLRKTNLLSGGMYIITSFDDSDYALGMVGSSLDNKAHAEVWQQDGSYTQKFMLYDQGNDVFAIVNVWSQRCLEVANSKAYDGATVWQNWWYGNDNQKWRAVWNGHGGIMFQSLLGNYALSTMGSYNASGIKLNRLDASSPFQGWGFVETSFGNTMSFSDRIKILDSIDASGLNVYRSLDGASSGAIDRIYKAIGNYENEGYSVGFVMIDLYSGASISYGLDNYFYSASTIKGPYVMSLLKYKPWLLNSWGGTLYDTINVSSNEAYAELRNNLGTSTLDSFVDWTHAWGFDYSSHYVWYTPRQLCKLWVGMADYLMGNEQDAWWARDAYGNNAAIYSRQELAWKGVPIYAKSGWVNGSINVHNEGYLVMDGSHPYVCVIMSNEIWQNNWKIRALMSAIDAAHSELV